ncbi:argininosuccinate synthase chloroplastic-like, partial [Trifolium pratense]
NYCSIICGSPDPENRNPIGEFFCPQCRSDAAGIELHSEQTMVTIKEKIAEAKAAWSVGPENSESSKIGLRFNPESSDILHLWQMTVGKSQALILKLHRLKMMVMREQMISTKKTDLKGHYAVKPHIPYNHFVGRVPYRQDISSFENSEIYDQADAAGFIWLYGLPMRVRAMLEQGI